MAWYWQVGVEIPIDSDDADEENKTENGRTLLNILSRGCAVALQLTNEKKSQSVLESITSACTQGKVSLDLFSVVVCDLSECASVGRLLNKHQLRTLAAEILSGTVLSLEISDGAAPSVSTLTLWPGGKVVCATQHEFFYPYVLLDTATVLSHLSRLKQFRCACNKISNLCCCEKGIWSLESITSACFFFVPE